MSDSQSEYSGDDRSASQSGGSSRSRTSQQDEETSNTSRRRDDDEYSRSRSSRSSRSRSASRSSSRGGSYSSRSRSRSQSRSRGSRSSSRGSYSSHPSQSSRSRSSGSSRDSRSRSRGNYRSDEEESRSRTTTSQASSRGSDTRSLGSKKSDASRSTAGSRSSKSRDSGRSSNFSGSRSHKSSHSKSSRSQKSNASSRSSRSRPSSERSGRDSPSFQEETVDENDSKRSGYSQGSRSKRSGDDDSDSRSSSRRSSPTESRSKASERSGRDSPSFEEETVDENNSKRSGYSQGSRSKRSGGSSARSSQRSSFTGTRNKSSERSGRDSPSFEEETFDEGSKRSSYSKGSRSERSGDSGSRSSRRSQPSERSGRDSPSFEEETFDEGSKRSSYSKSPRSHRSGDSGSRSSRRSSFGESRSRSSERSARDSPSFLEETVNDESTFPEDSRSKSSRSRSSRSQRSGSSRSSERSGRDSPSFLEETVNDESTFPEDSRSRSSRSRSSRSQRSRSSRSSRRSFTESRSRSPERRGRDHDDRSFESILGDPGPVLEDNYNDDASTFSDASLSDKESQRKIREKDPDISGQSTDGEAVLEGSFSDASFESKAQRSMGSAKEKQQTPVRKSPKKEMQQSPVRRSPKEEKHQSPLRKSPKEEKHQSPLRKSLKEEKQQRPVRKGPKGEKQQSPVRKSPKGEKQQSPVQKSPKEGEQQTPIKKSPKARKDPIVESSPKPHIHESEDPFKSPRRRSPKRDQTPQTKNKGSVGEPEKRSEGQTGELKVRFEPVVQVQRCRSLAILGTMSDAGKSIMTAGLCRVLANNGVRVAPFKGQNMSNNAAPALLPDKERRRRLYKSFQKAVGYAIPTPPTDQPDTGYGEIGTAQSLQAEACRIVPRVEMNPVLLKSGGQNDKGEYMCSVLVLGKEVARETYGDLGKRTTDLRTMVLESHQALAEVTECDVVLMEGAGSCTELNLMERDIVNLPLVRSLQCPWLLVANIDCGGVFAQIVGTKMCVSKRDWSLCAGIIVNKLRGEAKYFEPGPKMIEEMVGKPVFVVPFLRDLNLPEEDGVGVERRLAWEGTGHLHPEADDNELDKKPVVVVVSYPHTAISDDICPLEADPRFRVEWRRRRIPRPYPHTTAVIMPGSRLTRKDLKWLHDSGWAAFIRKHIALGGSVLGLCGGYQMLGWSVDDPDNIEGFVGSNKGLGLLPIRTKIEPPEVKVVAPRQGKLYPSGKPVEGFELHCGQSHIVMELGQPWGDEIHPLVVFDDGKPEGMCARTVRGTYMHGILWSPEARVELLVPDKSKFPVLSADLKIIDPLDRLAEHLESCGLDFETLRQMISSHRNR